MGALQNDVLNCFDDLFLDFDSVAAKLNIHVNQLYNLKKTGKIGFKTLLKVAQLISGADYHRHMREWCLKVTTTESIKHAFEYAAIKRDISLIEELLSAHRKDVSLSNYTQFYQMIYNYMVNTISIKDLKAHLDEMKCGKDKELKILKMIFNCYCLYHDQRFLSILEVASSIEKGISELGETRRGFFMECYLFRLAEVLAPAYLHLKDLPKARKYAEILLFSNICAKTNSDSYYYLGVSFMGEDEGKCLHYLREALRESVDSRDESIIRETRNTLKLYEGYFRYKNTGEIPTDLPSADEMLWGEDDPIIRYFRLIGAGTMAELSQAYKVYTQEFNYLFQSSLVDDLVRIGLDATFANSMKDIRLNYEGESYFEKDFIRSFTFWSDYCGDFCAGS